MKNKENFLTEKEMFKQQTACKEKLFEDYWYAESMRYGDYPNGSEEIEDYSIAKRAYMAGFYEGIINERTARAGK